jgi:hypothetical protein
MGACAQHDLYHPRNLALRPLSPTPSRRGAVTPRQTNLLESAFASEEAVVNISGGGPLAAAEGCAVDGAAAQVLSDGGSSAGRAFADLQVRTCAPPIVPAGSGTGACTNWGSSIRYVVLLVSAA